MNLSLYAKLVEFLSISQSGVCVYEQKPYSYSYLNIVNSILSLSIILGS